MTKLLEKAIKEIFQLPEVEQDSLGALILEELASEERWAIDFQKSKEELARLAEGAISEFRAGQTMPLSFDDQ